MTMFIRAVAAEDKAKAIKAAVSGADKNFFLPCLAQFAELPGSPFAYWVGKRVRSAFQRYPAVEGDGRAVRVGLQTSDDFRFLRAHWEIDASSRGAEWFPFAKGGQLSPFYASLDLVVNWDKDGEEMKAWADPLYDHSGWSRIIKSTEFYFHPGMTWPLRASRFAPQPLPTGCIFSVRGYSVFLPKRDLLAGLSIFNSKTFDYLFKALLGRFGYPEFIVGVLQKLPWAQPGAEKLDALEALARRAWRIKRAEDSAVETSHAFVAPARFNPDATIDVSSELIDVQRRIDAQVFDLYGFGSEEQAEIESAAMFAAAEVSDQSDGAEDEDPVEEHQADESAALVSWIVGTAFGRFDVRLATGEREPPPEPKPFDPLPRCSPGMLTGADGLPLEAPPPGYPIAFPRDGILADDPGDRADITGRVRAVFDCVFGAEADRFWMEAAQILGNSDGDLRTWLGRIFFEDTIRRYSKSRRKAPIYWQLATPSANYSVWLYYHRLTKETFYTVLSDHIDPKLQHEERRLGALLADGGDSPNARQRRQIAEQEAFVEELRAFREETARIAPLWNPNHDDGVIINFAPLWRLVQQHGIARSPRSPGR